MVRRLSEGTREQHLYMHNSTVHLNYVSTILIYMYLMCLSVSHSLCRVHTCPTCRPHATIALSKIPRGKATPSGNWLSVLTANLQYSSQMGRAGERGREGEGQGGGERDGERGGEREGEREMHSAHMHSNYPCTLYNVHVVVPGN